MDLRLLSEKQKNQYDKLVTHVIQSWQWGEFRKNFGPVLRYGIYKNSRLKTAFTITLHHIPLTNKYVGYLPKGPFPNQDLAQALTKIAKEQNCAFIKIEPNIELPTTNYQLPTTFHPSPKPLFTKYSFELDLTKSEEQLLANMHPKTRYNIKVAQKHGVKIEKKSDDNAFEEYLKLYFETTKRQNYHGHNKTYHKLVWKTLKENGMAFILLAYYQNKPLTTWMLLRFKDTLYYPYGGSSVEHKNVMANNLVAWEAIKLGQKMRLKKFDMWGALGENPDPKDPWFGFHQFKKGYGGRLVEFIGSFDLVLNWPIYFAFNLIDRLTPLKVLLLKLLGK